MAINKPLKDQISELAKIYYKNHKEQWIKNKYTVSDQRVMLTKWVRQAWDDLHRYDSKVIRQAFRDVGLALLVDGSQDDKIKIKDLPSIKVGNWQDWTLTEGVDQPFNKGVITNKSLYKVEAQAVDQDAKNESDREEEYI